MIISLYGNISFMNKFIYIKMLGMCLKTGKTIYNGWSFSLYENEGMIVCNGELVLYLYILWDISINERS